MKMQNPGFIETVTMALIPDLFILFLLEIQQVF